jgi:hypothetical protein
VAEAGWHAYVLLMCTVSPAVRSAAAALGSFDATAEYVLCVLLQVLYKRVCEYLELETRVEVLNTR